jgi:predicted dehydrogenase
MAEQERLAWGVAATGRIALEVGAVIRDHPRMHVAGVGSRDLARAQVAAGELGAPTAHGSYAELVEDPAVQAVYVATPHTGHAEVVEAALAAGKPVLCEKPLTAVAGRDRAAGRARAEHRDLPHGGHVDALQPAGPAAGGARGIRRAG